MDTSAVISRGNEVLAFVERLVDLAREVSGRAVAWEEDVVDAAPRRLRAARRATEAAVRSATEQMLPRRRSVLRPLALGTLAVGAGYLLFANREKLMTKASEARRQFRPVVDAVQDKLGSQLGNSNRRAKEEAGESMKL